MLKLPTFSGFHDLFLKSVMCHGVECELGEYLSSAELSNLALLTITDNFSHTISVFVKESDIYVQL